MIEKLDPKLLSIPLYVTYKNNSLCLELRKTTTKIELIKSIISAAFHEKPMVIQPIFLDKFRTINGLLDKGIIYLNKEDNQYYFVI